jgi:hypothetical protein
MKPIIRKSNKLFYKKYLYKIAFDLKLSSIFRKYYQKTNQLDYAIYKIVEYENELNFNPKKKHVEIGYYRKIRLEQEDIDDSRTLRDTLNSIDGYMVRQEYNDQLFVYLNDIDTLLPVLENLNTINKIQVWKPDPAILKNPEPDVLVTKLAADYQYKVSMYMWSLRKKESSALKWIENNRDKIKITDYSLEHAHSLAAVYVRDDKVLMLLQMTGNDFIGRIERLVLPS